MRQNLGNWFLQHCHITFLSLLIFCCDSHETVDARSNHFRHQQWSRLTSTALLSEVVRSSFYSLLTEGIAVLERKMGVP